QAMGRRDPPTTSWSSNGMVRSGDGAVAPFALRRHTRFLLRRHRSLQPHMDILLLSEAQHLGYALLAADAGLLVAAEGHAEEMPAHLVDPHEARLDHLGRAHGG